MAKVLGERRGRNPCDRTVRNLVIRGVHYGEEIRVVSGGKSQRGGLEDCAAEGQVVRLEMATETHLVSLHSLHTRRGHPGKSNKT